MSKYLVTGGAGFIGANFLLNVVENHKDDQFVCVDKLTYAANLSNLDPIMNEPNFKFVKGDICDVFKMYRLFKKDKFDYVINFAAETSVDKSFKLITPFFRTNVYGVKVLVRLSRRFKVKRFHQASTDEVYGSVNSITSDVSFWEDDTPAPSNPYAESKRRAEVFLLHYGRNHRKFDYTISRSSNCYGRFQYKDKLIPKTIDAIRRKQDITVYGDGSNIRDWLSVDTNCEAIDFIVRHGEKNEIYNISEHNLYSNLEIVKTICNKFNYPEEKIKFVKDRKRHDLKYSMKTVKLRKLGFATQRDFAKEFDRFLEEEKNKKLPTE